MTPLVVEDRLRYAKQYASILIGNVDSNILNQLSPNKRIHIMKALSSLARFTGKTEEWRQIRQQYQLSWSTNRETRCLSKFFDSSKDLDTMIGWLKQALQQLPADYANFLLFCTLTGLRASECVEAVRLLNGGFSQNSDFGKMAKGQYYYNSDQKILQHYRFPDLFIRRTKACYVSVVNDQIVGIARSIGKTRVKCVKNAVLP
jgi:hypothetical protein